MAVLYPSLIQEDLKGQSSATTCISYSCSRALWTIAPMHPSPARHFLELMHRYIIIIISFAIRQYQVDPTKPSFDMTILCSCRDECTLNTKPTVGS